MIGPTWLAAIFGTTIIVAALAALVRIIVAWRTRKATDVEIDIHNVVMGVSMAGMLIPTLPFVTIGPSTTAWIIAWILVAIWFAASVIRDAARRKHGARFSGHHLPHFIMSGAMVYMFAVAQRSAGSILISPMSAMPAMSSAKDLVPLPMLNLALVIFMVGYAVLVVDRLPVVAITGTGDLQIIGQRRTETESLPSPLAPRVAAATNVVMAITMGYSLTMMFV